MVRQQNDPQAAGHFETRSGVLISGLFNRDPKDGLVVLPLFVPPRSLSVLDK